MRSFSWRAAGAMVAGVAAAPATAVCQAGDPAPRIDSVSPSPPGGINDQVGLTVLDTGSRSRCRLLRPLRSEGGECSRVVVSGFACDF